MYWYLGSPYSKFPRGLDAACECVCKAAAQLIRAGVPVFSPIAHSHAVAEAGDIDALDHAIWLPADEPLMKAAGGLIVLMMDTWEVSFGLSREIKHFIEAGKPVVYMSPGLPPKLPPLSDWVAEIGKIPLNDLLNPISEGCV